MMIIIEKITFSHNKLITLFPLGISLRITQTSNITSKSNHSENKWIEIL